MSLPSHKTKIVATIGPASEAPEMLARLIRAGLNVARLNFSHGDFADHAERIARLRAALELIAAPMRPDGSYNRDREACGILARAALNTLAN